ncbi:sensor histidine kinase [Hydrogenovibrio halophilus]|uniref:sensor histidine kinase n=1 Tax=Hydrogenovibrio halophilus TaxID=373391 RepID=UPI00037B9425|nr:sensor histidine kinase [Hydrogenovibrio halophilus]
MRHLKNWQQPLFIHLFWAMFLVVVCSHNVLAETKPDNDCPQAVSLNNDMALWIESSPLNDVKQIIEQKFDPIVKNVGLGFRDEPVWVRVMLSRPEKCDRTEWLVQFNLTYNDMIDFYLPDSQSGWSHWRMGDQVPHPANLSAERFPTIPVELTADAPQPLYVRVESRNALAFDLTLISPMAQQIQEAKVWTLSVIVGILMLIMMLLSLLAALILRFRESWYFFLYVIAIITILGFVHGWTNKFLPPGWNDPIIVFSQILAVMFLLWVSNKILALSFHLPRIYLIQQSFVWGTFLVSILSVMLNHYQFILPAIHFLIVIIMLTLLMQTLWLWRTEKLAKLFMTLFGVLFVGIGLRMAGLHGIIAKTFWTDNALTLALVIKVILIFVTLMLGYFREREKTFRFKALADQKQKEIEQRRTFLNLLTHELMTPLAVLDSNTRNLQDEIEALLPKQNRTIGKQRNAIKRMRHLVDWCLSSESSRHLARRPEPIQPLMHELEQEITDLFATDRLAWSLPADVPPNLTVVMQKDAVIKALSLIIDNALKYSPADKKVTLSCKISGKKMRFCVKDEGTGFHESDFAPEAFKRGRSSKNTSGLGLGLTLAQEIFQANDIELSIDSTSRGSRVCALIHDLKFA